MGSSWHAPSASTSGRPPLTPFEATKRLLEHMHGYPVFESFRPDKVAVTVPASFQPKQRNDIMNAAAKAGFYNPSIIDEPYAAVLPYLKHDDVERVVGVYDLGGGTFDFAVLRVHGMSHWVLATGGDQYLGGDDIDLRVAEYVLKEALRKYRQDLKSDVAVYHRLLLAAENAKVSLSAVEQIAIDLAKIDPSLNGKMCVLLRDDLEKLCADLVRKTFVAVDEVLAKAKVQPKEVSDVILVGGSTRMPGVRKIIKEYFGKEPLSTIEPDQVVALGAAMAAAVLAGDRHVLR